MPSKVKLLFDIPADFLQAIGEVIVAWNYLEQILNFVLIDYLEKSLQDHKSHVVFAHMSFPQKIDILGALAEVRLKADPAALENCKSKVIPALKTAQNKRNIVIHSTWGVKDGVVTWSLLSARGSLKFKWVPVKVEEIRQISDLIEEARQRLSEMGSPSLLRSIRENRPRSS